MNYFCYNLTFASEIELPELNALPTVKGEADIHIRLGSVPVDGLPDGKQLGPYLWVGKRDFWLEVPDIVRFLVHDGREITIDPQPGVDEDSIRVFLLGSAFGALLFQRGYLVMHGNAIQVGDECLLCVGHSGTGKSTLAAAFLQRGHKILADDVVPIDDQCCALPGYPRIKLWQDSADRLAISTDGLRRIRPDTNKFNYPVHQHFVEEPLPVKWVYILNSHHKDETLFEPIRGMDRYFPLLHNTYRKRFMKGMTLEAEHLKRCSQLAKRIRLVRVTRPSQGFDVDALLAHILADIQQTGGQS